MEIKFLARNKVKSTIRGLLAEYDQLHWAVAWGKSTSLARDLLSHSAKIRAVTFGLAFAHTDPDLVDSLVGVNGCYVVTNFPGGTFHPKVYAFRSGNRVAAVVGSANFTRGGLSNNCEACVLITGSVDDEVLADALSFVKESVSLGECVTKELAQRYRFGYERAKLMTHLPLDPLAGVPPASGLSSRLVGMDWDEYVRKVEQSRYYRDGAGLKLLRTVQDWLSAAPSFHELTTPRRKAIAGILGETENQQEMVGDEALNQGWKAFGSMQGAGTFKNFVINNNRSLACAVDSIPQKGTVTREQFDRFSRLFLKAFRNSKRGGGVARGGGITAASRLLAMKRPDVFLCISGPNLTLAAEWMGFHKTKLLRGKHQDRLDYYWDHVVEVIRASDWYNIDKPETRRRKLWKYRAAMLDVIFYNPYPS